MGSQGKEDKQQGSGGWWSHIHVLITRRNNWGVRQTTQPRVPAQEKKSFKTSDYKNLWGLWWWEKLPASQESSLERPTGS